MLARQAWRLLQQSDGLCAQILKARHFPYGNILNAIPSDGMEYTWRSILHGVNLVREGYIWRIGNDKTVRSGMILLGSENFFTKKWELFGESG
jgi:hypothetical protein